MTIALGMLVLVLSLFLNWSVTYAADATFSWTPNEESGTGYKIYYGNQSRTYDSHVDVGTPEVMNGSMQGTVTGLVEGQTYYFAATAYNDFAESAYSTEVVYAVPDKPVTPSAPLSFGFEKVVLYTVDGSKRITIEADGSIIIEDL